MYNYSLTIERNRKHNTPPKMSPKLERIEIVRSSGMWESTTKTCPV